MLIVGPLISFGQGRTSTGLFSWQSSPPLPVEQGLSGGFSGFHKNTLIYAGGNNFTAPRWEGGVKQYHREIFILKQTGQPESGWEKAGRLASPIADGATIETEDGILCLGGSDGENVSSSVFLLRWENHLEKVVIDSIRYPRLPVPCTQPAAVRLNNFVYLAGGKDTLGNALQTFWRLNLNAKDGWEELNSWPGPARYGASLIVQNNGEEPCIYLFSGKSDSRYLRDGYVYNPEKKHTWEAIAQMPRAAYWAPATSIGPSHIMVFSGSDGHSLDQIPQMTAPEDYQFVPDILSYHTITDTWVTAGELPEGGLVGARAITKDNKLWIVGGETAPSVRSAEVQLGFFEHKEIKSLFGWPDYIVLVIYMLLLGGISWFFSRRNKTADDFLLGGQRVPAWAAGISVMATQVSAIGFMTIPAKTYAVNWAYFAGVFTWFIVVPVVAVYFIPLIRKIKITSVYHYLESRFNPAVRLFASTLYLVFQLARMGLVLYLPALALSAVTPLDTLLCILVMGVLSTFYTVIGGIEGVIWIEVVQALLLFLGAITCIYIGINGINCGWGVFFDTAMEDNKLSLGKWDWDLTSSTLLAIILGNIVTRLGNLTTDQAVVQRYLTTSTTKEAQKTVWTDVWASIPWAIIVYLLGTVLYVFYKQHANELHPLGSTDGILPYFIAYNAPMGISGLIITGIFAASMSSSQSHIHSLATVITTDFYSRFRNLTPEQTYKTARGWTIGLGAVSTLLAVGLLYLDIYSLLDFFQELTGLFIGASAGLFMLGIFTQKANSTGVLLGSFLSVGILYYVKTYTPLNFWLYGMIGLVVCLSSGYIFSLFLPGKKQTEGLTIFDGLRNNRDM